MIEEMYPLSCSIDEMNQFIDGSKPAAAGWMSFYWGKTVAEDKAEKRGIAEDGDEMAPILAGERGGR